MGVEKLGESRACKNTKISKKIEFRFQRLEKFQRGLSIATCSLEFTESTGIITRLQYPQNNLQLAKVCCSEHWIDWHNLCTLMLNCLCFMVHMITVNVCE